MSSAALDVLDQPAGALLVAEIFETIQGEGPSLGTPATFLRLGACNLACSWCDTPYTWDWTGRNGQRFNPRDELTPWTAEALLARLRQGPRRVVITGGEPLLQAACLVPVLAGLLKYWQVEIETNGTLVPPEGFGRMVTQWNVSPKLSTSGNPKEKRTVPDALAWFAAEPDAIFKFVVDTPADLAEVDRLVLRHRVRADRVFLMPQGRSADELAIKSAWLVPACIARGFRFTPRLHILLWGNERGR